MATFDLFVSYPSEEKAVVHRLVERLDREGFKVWLDHEQLDPGDSISAGIEQGIRDSRYLAVCISRHLKRSQWCQIEYSSFLQREVQRSGSRIIPLVVGDYEREDVPLLLYDRVWVDIREEVGVQVLLRKLRKDRPVSDLTMSGVFSVGKEITAAPVRAGEEPADEIDSFAQLWFPHPIARSLFLWQLRKEEPEARSAYALCLRSIVGTLLAMALADYVRGERSEEIQALLLSSALGDVRLELLYQLTLFLRDRVDEPMFAGELADWVLRRDGNASEPFQMLRRLCTSSASVVGSPRDLTDVLRSLGWLASYRFISLEGLRPTVSGGLEGVYRVLVGALSAFTPQRMVLQRPELPGEGFFVVARDGGSLLRVEPFFLLSSRSGSSSARCFLFERFRHDRALLMRSTEDEELVLASSTPQARSLADSQGRSDALFVLSDRNAFQGAAPLTPAPLQIGPYSVTPVAHKAGTEPPVNPAEVKVAAIESRLIGLLSLLPESGDRLLLDLGEIGAEIEEVLSGGELQPALLSRLEDAAIDWQDHVDRRLMPQAPLEHRRIFGMRRRQIAERMDILLARTSLGEESLIDFGGRDLTEQFRVTLGRNIKWMEAEALLLAGDALEQEDAIEFLLREDTGSLEQCLKSLFRDARSTRIQETLWSRSLWIWLYHRRHFWHLGQLLVHADEERWGPRFFALRQLLLKKITHGEAEVLLKAFPEADQRIMGGFLVCHRNKECRTFGYEWLPRERRWDLLLAPGIHPVIIRELVELCCADCDDSYVKALFVLLRPRLLAVTSLLDLARSYEIMMSFYRRPLFLEDTFFHALLKLHRGLSAIAQKSPVTVELDRRYAAFFESFCRKVPIRDNEIQEMRHVPLPVQRMLAHYGHFLEVFVCNVRDLIALETVRHVCARPDVQRFLRMPRINGRVLEEVARNKMVMREPVNRVTFCKNPKAKAHQVREFLPFITHFDISEIAKDKSASTFAREMAAKMLSRRS